MYRRSVILFCAMTLVFGYAMAASAAEGETLFKKGSLYLTPTAGALIFLGDDEPTPVRPGFAGADYDVGAIMGLRLGYFLSDHFSLEGAFEYSWCSADVLRTPPGQSIFDDHVNVWLGLFNVLYHFKPVLSDNLSPFLLAGVGVDSFTAASDWDVGAAFNYGLGLHYKLTDLLSLRGELRHLITTHPGTNALIVNLGLGLHFGGAEEPLPPPPPPPPPPVVDSDGDGVPDHLDQCPGTPAGAPVDDVGCPYLSDEGVLYEMPLDGAIQRGIVFELNSAKILPSAFPMLDDVAATIKDYPNAKVEIAGYTDSTGADDYNLRLSQARADSVRDYLISKGVPATQLTTAGYGEAHPVASNATRDGRAMNRRIEFHLLTPVDMNAVKEGSVLYKLNNEGIVISGVVFEVGSAKIKPASHEALTAMARTLRAFRDVKVEVAGYTDSTGSADFNLKLSQKRAESVRSYLIARGVNPDQLVAVGYGIANPIASNETAEGRAQNRRIQFKTISK